MPGAEQLIQWRNGIAVIEVEILVVQHVVPVPGRDAFTAYLHKVKAGMRRRRTYAHIQAVQNNNQRMHRYKPEQSKTAKVQQVLDGVHGYTCPGASIDVAVMQFMRDPVQRLPVREAVDEVEVNSAPEKYREDAEKRNTSGCCPIDGIAR